MRESIEAMLELLMVEGSDAPTVLVPQLPGAGRGELASALLEAAPQGRRRMLPGPVEGVDDDAVRRWHRDAWLAMSRDERASVVVAAGPGVASLAPLLSGRGEIVVAIHEPLEAIATLARAGVPIPSPQGLRTPDDERNQQQKRRIRSVANPQAHALLMSSPEFIDFTPTLGPPPDADRWRTLLFEQTMPLVRPLLADQVPEAVETLAGRFGSSDRRKEGAAKVSRTRAEGLPLKPPHVDLLRQLNWLDAELYDYCTERGHG